MGKQVNKFASKKQVKPRREPKPSNDAILAKAREVAVQNEHSAVLEHDPAVEESTQASGVMALVEKYSSKVNEAINPLIAEGERKLLEGRELQSKHDRSFVAVAVIRKTIRLCETTEGHQLKKLVEEKAELERELSQTRTVDGVKVPAALAGTSLRQIVDDIDRQVKRIHNQIAVVIATEFNLDPDEAFKLVKDEELNFSKRQMARKGQ